MTEEKPKVRALDPHKAARRNMKNALKGALQDLEEGIHGEEVRQVIVITATTSRSAYTIRSQGSLGHLIELGLLAQAQHAALHEATTTRFDEEDFDDD